MTEAVTLLHIPLLMLSGNLLWHQLRLNLLKKKMMQTSKMLKIQSRSKRSKRKTRRT